MFCQMGEMERLVNSRNEARSDLSAAVDDFLQEVDKLPVSERLERLTVCYHRRLLSKTYWLFFCGPSK